MAALLAGAAALAADRSPAALAAVLLVAVVAIAVGWPRLIDLPSPRGSSWVAGGTGVLALAAVLLVGGLIPLLLVLAAGIIAAFVHEMVRGSTRPRLVESVSGTVLGAVAVASSSAWVALAVSGVPGLAGAVLAGAAAGLAAAAIVAALPLGQRARAVLAVVAGGLAGLGVGHLVPDLGLVVGALVGGVSGMVTVATVAILGPLPTSERTASSAAIAALPLVVLGVPAYAAAALLAA